MWRRDEVHEEVEYRVCLCQAKSGRRTYALHVAHGDLPLPPETIFVTDIVPIELLLSGHIPRISETIRLTTGERFFIEAHNVWFTSTEMQALESNDHDWEAVPWVNGLWPLLPPR